MRYEPEEILAKAKERGRERASQAATSSVPQTRTAEYDPEHGQGLDALDPVVAHERPDSGNQDSEDLKEFLKMTPTKIGSNYFRYFVKMKGSDVENALSSIIAANDGDKNKAYEQIKAEVDQEIEREKNKVAAGGNTKQVTKGQKDMESFIYDMYDDGESPKRMMKKLRAKGYDITGSALKEILRGFKSGHTDDDEGDTDYRDGDRPGRQKDDEGDPDRDELTEYDPTKD